MSTNNYAHTTTSSANFAYQKHDPDELQKVAIFNGLKIIDVDAKPDGFSIKCKRGKEYLTIEIHKSLITVFNSKKEIIIKMGEEMIETLGVDPNYYQWNVGDKDMPHWTAGTSSIGTSNPFLPINSGGTYVISNL